MSIAIIEMFWRCVFLPKSRDMLKYPLQVLASEKASNLNIDALKPSGIAAEQFGETKSSLKEYSL